MNSEVDFSTKRVRICLPAKRRAFSSVGRASPLQGEGQKFESSNAHHKKRIGFVPSLFLFCVLMTRTSNMQSIFKEVRRERAEAGVFCKIINIVAKYGIAVKCERTREVF